MNSEFMTLSKNDFVKSVSPAIFGGIIPLVTPVYNGLITALLAGKLPVLPTLDDTSMLLLKCLGISISASVGYIAHKFFSNANGDPFNGALAKYIDKYFGKKTEESVVEVEK